ncbi:hypothetical protein BGZ76_010438 [Entomortierella beljakovae]|nr:hypothetical protein BGZ76_010438 [Entomortierella beljakovae]
MNTKKQVTTSTSFNQRPSPYSRPVTLPKSNSSVNNNNISNSRKPIGAGIQQQNTLLHPSFVTIPESESIPVNDLVQLARKSFSSKDFLDAVQYLTRALIIAPKDINLLDSRAASLEKLARFNDALVDAKAMIQIHPQNPKGYLRAGKIFRGQQNLKSSSKIYSAGIERCANSSGSKDYEANPGSDCKRSELKVGGDCQARSDYESNNKVINKTVLGLVKFAPPKALRLGCAHQLSGGLLTQIIRMKRAAALETLSLRMNSKIYDQEFMQFWSSTPMLRFLDLHDCLGVSDSVVTSVLDRCPLLEELDVSSCRITEACMMINSTVPLTNMKKLTFGRWEYQFAKEGVDALVSRFPNLETLDIRTMRPRGIEALESLALLRNLKHLYTDSIEAGENATSFIMQRWVAGIEGLESLQMNACKGVSDTTICFIAAGLSAEVGSTRRGWSHSLKMLDLSSSPYLTNEGLEFLKSNPLPNLHTLILNKCGRMIEQGLRDAVTSSGLELSRLECGGYWDVSDNLLNDIKDHCPKIEYLHLANSGQVTGISLIALVIKRGRSLERICVDNCPKIGVDAVERAREILGEYSRVSFIRSHR